MRGQHDGQPSLGDRVGEGGEKVPPGEWVERGDRFVK
jgi:hypothetical protein